MFTITSMPSTTSVLSAYTSFAASAMLVRAALNEVQNMTNQFMPQKLREKILSWLESLTGNTSSCTTIIIDEYNGSMNEIYQACEIYLSTRINPSVEELKVSKRPKEKSFSVSINKGQKIVDEYEDMKLTWEFVHIVTKKPYVDYEDNSVTTESDDHKSYRLGFHKRYMEKVLSTYLPHVIEKSNAIKQETKLVKLYQLGNYVGDSINLDHPSTFDTIAMDPVIKQALIDDLDRFVKRREFYRRVGKAWKRGYLLYGPPGTGKSSLIAAMANYLKFDIYDMELTSLRGNSELRRLLLSTGNKSILVIEDIDCTIELENRQYEGFNHSNGQLTLSGLLNFIDGLWSSCGDERIIVFTTNYREKLDPALLRPGRMDMHIHMSYLTPSGFHTLAYNYLRIRSHSLFTDIEELIKEVEVTPAEVAEELMKSEDPDNALKTLVLFLQKKKQMKCSENNVEVKDGDDEKENENKNEEEKEEIKNEEKEEEEEEEKKVKRNKRKSARKGKANNKRTRSKFL